MATLFDSLCSIDCLYDAWKQIKSKNAMGGIDKLTPVLFEENLQENLLQLQKELQAGLWNPEPYLRIEIKKNKTEKRKLGLLSIKDKVVQQAIKNLAEPLFESVFISNSYGYRPGRGHLKAVRRTIHEFRQRKNTWIVQLDIDNYFDTIDHEILFSNLPSIIKDKEIIRLIDLSVKTGSVTKKMKWNEVKKGVPQGAVLSPLLANFYLHAFDQFIINKTDAYIRYADDFLLLADSQEQAVNLMQCASAFLRKQLLLKLNQPLICKIQKGIEFLGVVLQDKYITISETKKEKLLQQINSIELLNGSFSSKSLESIYGIKNYYAQLLPFPLLDLLDKALISKIDSLITSNTFKSKKNLIGSLKVIPFFARENELKRKEQIKQWENLYSKTKINTQGTGKDFNKKLIENKKREYQKREAEGAELVVASFGYVIGKSNKGIVIKNKGKNVRNASDNLEHITVISKGISISSDAIHFCMNNNIPIDFFDASGKLTASILSPVYIEQSLWLKQTTLSIQAKIYLASCIVTGKLKNQLNLIKYYHKYHKGNIELCHVYKECCNCFELLFDKLEQSEISETNYPQVLMSYEATGATAYWKYIRQLFKDDNIIFESRIRKGATDLFNSLLNYGYALLYSRIWQAILSVKLNPAIGFLHADQPGKPTLVFDLTELFRTQAVDRVVIGLVQKKEPLSMKKGLLEENTKKLLIQNILERINRYEKYRNKEIKFSKIIREQARELAAFIDNKNKSFKPYISKW